MTITIDGRCHRCQEYTANNGYCEGANPFGAGHCECYEPITANIESHVTTQREAGRIPPRPADALNGRAPSCPPRLIAGSGPAGVVGENNPIGGLHR